MVKFLDKIAAGILGCYLIKVGFDIIYKGGAFISYGFYGNYSKYGKGRFIFASFFIFVGVLILYWALTNKPKNKSDNIDNNDEYLICPQCEETYSSEKITDGKCPHCSVKLELLEGYFERKKTALKTGDDETKK